MGWSLKGVLWTLCKELSCCVHLHLLCSWWSIYHPLVLVLVQELLAVSVISFRGVVAQLFGCSLIL